MVMIDKWLCDLFDMEETSCCEYVLKYIQDHPEEKKELQKLGVDEERLIETIKERLRHKIWDF